VNMTRVAHPAARCALGGIPRHPVDNPSTCGSSLIAHEILSKQPEPPLRGGTSIAALCCREGIPLIHIAGGARTPWRRGSTDRGGQRAPDTQIALASKQQGSLTTRVRRTPPPSAPQERATAPPQAQQMPASKGAACTRGTNRNRKQDQQPGMSAL
jgi:hypothetical protein